MKFLDFTDEPVLKILMLLIIIITIIYTGVLVIS